MLNSMKPVVSYERHSQIKVTMWKGGDVLCERRERSIADPNDRKKKKIRFCLLGGAGWHLQSFYISCQTRLWGASCQAFGEAWPASECTHVRLNVRDYMTQLWFLSTTLRHTDYPLYLLLQQHGWYSAEPNDINSNSQCRHRHPDSNAPAPNGPEAF